MTAAAFLLFCLWSGILWKAGKSRQERERELLEEEIRLYEKQFNVIRQSQDHIRSLKHDMKHHIKMLADMVAEDKKEEALKYEQLGEAVARTQTCGYNLWIYSIAVIQLYVRNAFKSVSVT